MILPILVMLYHVKELSLYLLQLSDRVDVSK